MQSFERDDVVIHYLERGGGFPVLLFAPGGMRSAASYWKNSPWNPVGRLDDAYRVIAMDQRNAGASTAKIGPDEGWQTYTADHLALLDHLGVERCHLIGGCIGGSYCMGMIQAAPERVASAVLQQPIGHSPQNRQAFYDMFDGWAREIAPQHPEIDEAGWDAFRARMYDGDFLFNVDRDVVRECPVPLLVLMGNDLYHPEATSREIVDLAPRAELVERWKDGESLESAVARVRAFLKEHTPG